MSVRGDELVGFLYSDLSGLNRGRAVPADQLERRIANGVGWVPANQAMTPFDVVVLLFLNFTGKLLTDSQGGGTDPSVDIPRYLDLYRLGKLKLDQLITHRFALDDINTALEKMRSGETGRTIIEF